VKVSVETTTHLTASGDEEIERTKVNVEMPTGNPDLPLPTNPQEMLAEARKMVAEAQKIGGPSKGKGKRKVQEMLDDDDDDELDVGPALPPKRARKLEIELRKERIARRALTGIAASLLLGCVLFNNPRLFLSSLLT